ncbi:MAG TPA: hypothetical protein VIV35_12690 [Chitinophagaceae bacterium]
MKVVTPYISIIESKSSKIQFELRLSGSTCIDIGGSRAGTVAGIMNFFGQTGAFFLAITFGKVADIANNFNPPVLALAAILVTGSILWIFVDPSKPLLANNTNYEIGQTKKTIVLMPEVRARIAIE